MPLPQYSATLFLGASLLLAPGGGGARAELVINEVHYDAEPKTEFVEFIELLNTGPDPVDLGAWSFTDGVTVSFPPETLLGVSEYLILAENPTALAAKFPSIPVDTRVIEFGGSLSNDGERLELRGADGSTIDVVDYRAEFPWPIAPNGEGDSMQLINATLDNDLGAAWRGALPTPGLPNAVFADNAPPLIRHVDHAPRTPASSAATTISAKITDPDGVTDVNLLYQTAPPGAFIPAFLPHNFSTLTGNPSAPQQPNPAFEDPANWTAVPMVGDGGGTGIFTALIPGQPNRTLVRYRIVATDSLGVSVRVPYPDDGSLNFAYFVYDGVPAWIASSNSVHPDGAGHSYSADVLTSLPVYTMITRDADRAYAYAYSSTGDAGFQIPKDNIAARKVFNWECALVYDGVVYDHVGWRLRQRNDRYAGNGKRSMRFRFRRGHYFQARGEDGKKLRVKWRSLNTGKMSRFGGTNTYGLYEAMNSKLWRMVGVECPYFLPVHFRMIDGADEAPDQHNGDFFGLASVVQDIDGRLLDERGLPNGNIYKLKDGVSNPLELQRNQARAAVVDGSDFQTIKTDLDSSQSDTWLRDHVDWEQWARYHAVVEAVRHYDFGTTPVHFKNRAWYFKPEPGTPYGLLRLIPHDHDASWLKGYHDSLNSQGVGIGTGYPFAAIFDSIARPPNGTEKSEFTRGYRNFIREFRDLLWQEETVHAMVDDHVALLEAFSFADRDRWSGGSAAAGIESMTAIAAIAAGMKSIAFVSDTMYGRNLPGGRAAFLDQVAADTAIPNKPTISYSGAAGFPAGQLAFTTSAFSDPQGAGTFGKLRWRVAEVSGLGTAAVDPVIASGDTWKYFDVGIDPGTAWSQPGFDDSAWGEGPSQIGYGEADEMTTVTGGHATSYFRRVIDIDDPALYGSFAAGIIRDDGAIAYVNGVEVWRDQMPAGAVDFTTLASASASGSNETEFHAFTIPASLIVAGENLIAVEVHQRNAGSSDMSFDFRLDAIPVTPERKFEWEASWESGDRATFRDTVTPPAAATRSGHSYRARVRHADDSGRWSHWSEPLEFTASQPGTRIYTDALVISEIMYHPADPSAAEIGAGFVDDDQFEYIELRNVGAQALDLSDLRFTKGVDFEFAGSAVTTLAPGAYVIVANKLTAFEMRYGAGKPVAGAWGGKLDNGGEQLKLSFGAGEAIRDFVYDDTPPWPTGPDAAGFSLVLADPLALPNHADPHSWRPSVSAGGTPGNTDGTTFPGGSAAEFLTYATGESPSVAALADGNVDFGIELNRLAEDVIGQFEASTDLLAWKPAGALVTRTAVEPTSPGRARVTFSTTVPPVGARWFLRYRVAQR